MSDEHKKGGNKPKGFAANPENRNKTGRPKGSRNKSSILKAQLVFDSETEEAAMTLAALMRNDKDFLGIGEDVPLSLRKDACKLIMDKSLANEKDKEEKASKELSKAATANVRKPPTVSAVATKKS
tara:strand:- start:648 stop:1025 length:378 start_codon:yes stop_codon:yes gene_type:complete